ncbi:hypothetical protein ACF09K_33710 [Streptomyces sp. NPDC014882]|uniref:hypothetical protein n=1 Tax=Streptomyces sp. NPDC014882 TaxID=3364927 RepID=UPI0036FD8C90
MITNRPLRACWNESRQGNEHEHSLIAAKPSGLVRRLSGFMSETVSRGRTGLEATLCGAVASTRILDVESRGELSPQDTRNAAEFVELLRRLKEQSGLTYRQIEERAAESGEVLARSTLADVLGGNTRTSTAPLSA